MKNDAMIVMVFKGKNIEEKIHTNKLRYRIHQWSVVIRLVDVLSSNPLYVDTI